MTNTSLTKEIVSKSTWWIHRVLDANMATLLFSVGCIFLSIGLDANGVTSAYIFGWALFLAYIALVVWKK